MIQKQPREVFYKKAVLKNFVRNIHRKTPVLEPLFNKVDLQACNFIKKRFHRSFPVNIAKFLRIPI